MDKKTETERENTTPMKFLSLFQRKTELIDFVCDNHLDVVGICETWLSPDDLAVIADMTPDGYIFKHVPRSNRRGGGIGLLHRSGLQVNICKTPQNFISFESMQAEIIDNAVSIHLVIIYRPPGSKHPFSGFIDEFARLADSFLI